LCGQKQKLTIIDHRPARTGFAAADPCLVVVLGIAQRDCEQRGLVSPQEGRPDILPLQSWGRSVSRTDFPRARGRTAVQAEQRGAIIGVPPCSQNVPRWSRAGRQTASKASRKCQQTPHSDDYALHECPHSMSWNHSFHASKGAQHTQGNTYTRRQRSSRHCPGPPNGTQQLSPPSQSLS